MLFHGILTHSARIHWLFCPRELPAPSIFVGWRAAATDSRTPVRVPAGRHAQRTRPAHENRRAKAVTRAFGTFSTWAVPAVEPRGTFRTAREMAKRLHFLPTKFREYPKIGGFVLLTTVHFCPSLKRWGFFLLMENLHNAITLTGITHAQKR